MANSSYGRYIHSNGMSLDGGLEDIDTCYSRAEWIVNGGSDWVPDKPADAIYIVTGIVDASAGTEIAIGTPWAPERNDVFMPVNRPYKIKVSKVYAVTGIGGPGLVLALWQ